jgi:hypothetical protein
MDNPKQHDTRGASLQPSLAEDAAEAARDFAAEAADVTASLAADLQQAAKATTRAAKEQASAFAADIGHELTQVADEQKVRGTEALEGFVRAIDRAAGELETQSPTVARYVRDAAKQVDGLSHNIRGRSVAELMRAATDLARSQPAIFFAGAVAAGFAFSRFLKSSAGDGGAQSSGGMQSSGGTQWTGGTQSKGGTQSMGGTQSSGGTQSTGGTKWTGGTQPTSVQGGARDNPAHGTSGAQHLRSGS